MGKDRGSESGGGLDFLFQFSPVRTEENQENPGAETSRLPVRGDTVEDLDQSFSRSSRKKQKLFKEMKTVVKLEKSRQSARECRARKKLRYQYLDDLILEREQANERLRGEMNKFVTWCAMLDQNNVPEGMQEFLSNVGNEDMDQQG